MFYPHTIKGKVNLRLDLIGAVQNITPPVISGDLGIGDLLTVAPGSWIGAGTITFAYQWLRDGLIIVGETATTYTTVLADDGTEITCLEYATDDNGTSQAVTATTYTTVLADDGTEITCLEYATDDNGTSQAVSNVLLPVIEIPFIPSDIAGQYFWGKADDGYVDLSLGSPVIETNMAILSAEINGHDSFDFNGSNAYINSTKINSYGLPLTASMVVKSDVADASFRSILEIGANSSTAVLISKDNNNKLSLNIVGNGGAVTTTLSLGTGYNIITITIDPSENVLIYLNGVQDASGNPAGTYIAGTVLGIGRYSGGSQYWNGNMPEVNIYNTVLSTSDREDLESYYENEYNL